MIISTPEAANIYNKKANALVRPFSSCPYEAKQKFTLQIKRDGKLVPFAYCIVRSVRPVTKGDYEEDPELAKGEGYSSTKAWKLSLVRNYGKLKQPLFRISFNVEALHEQIIARQEAENAQSNKKDWSAVPESKNVQHKFN